ncbi:MAG: S1C family serine protease [Lachnospiraceae bacterium]|nr:S1C family serine protease [Lachnospiraceae bacterium]
MPDNNEKNYQVNNENRDSEVKSDGAEIQAIKTTEFMKETIKQRPINKRKLVRRLLVTVSMALVFGIVACLTFIVLEPIINQRITNKDEQLNTVTFVEETAEEETKREDMIADESELIPVIKQQIPVDSEQIEEVLSNMEWGVSDYISLSNVVTDMTKSVSTSLVLVTGIKQDTDLFDNYYDNENSISGVIIADNGRDILILANLKNLINYDRLEVEFFDETSSEASILMKDLSTGFGIVAVRKNMISSETCRNLTFIEMGSSASKNLVGSPIVAVGSPYGVYNSIGIGFITSVGKDINVPDAVYKLLYTDITASSLASGVLVNLNGQLVGIIDQSYNPSDVGNIVSAVGITELKKLVEKLSNGIEIPYLGLYGTDVTDEISESLEIPKGVYITGMEQDSPLLEAGIQNGDIIVKFAGVDIQRFKEYSSTLWSMSPETEVEIVIMRQSPEDYSSLSMNVALDHQK